MNTEIGVHPVQTKILKILLFKPKARFSELNKTRLTNDHFSFHINQLVSYSLIDKTDSGEYYLTQKGKEFANRMDTEKIVIEKQAKVSSLVVCVRKNKGATQYLLQQRLKHPYFGFYGFVTGKIRWGETALETAQRELKEETGLGAELTFCGVEHKTDYSTEGNLLEDKFFFIFKGYQVEGRLVEEFEGGKNLWLSEKEIRKNSKIFKDVLQIIETVKGKQLRFFENKFTEDIY